MINLSESNSILVFAAFSPHTLSLSLLCSSMHTHMRVAMRNHRHFRAIPQHLENCICRAGLVAIVRDCSFASENSRCVCDFHATWHIFGAISNKSRISGNAWEKMEFHSFPMDVHCHYPVGPFVGTAEIRWSDGGDEQTNTRRACVYFGVHMLLLLLFSSILIIAAIPLPLFSSTNNLAAGTHATIGTEQEQNKKYSKTSKTTTAAAAYTA